jgi:hypothetical protein
MQAWMILWGSILVISGIGFLVLLVVVSKGAIQELKLTLDELRADTQESAEHPEILDEAI